MFYDKYYNQTDKTVAKYLPQGCSFAEFNELKIPGLSSLTRVTIRPAFGGTIPLFEALSRFFDRKSRFLPLCNRTHFTKFMDTSFISLTKAGRRSAFEGLIIEPRVRIWNRRQKLVWSPKKKRSTPSRLRNLFTFGLQNDTKRGTDRRWPFFFFYGDHPNFRLRFVTCNRQPLL